jgi:excisionase family DNA binding protein
VNGIDEEAVTMTRNVPLPPLDLMQRYTTDEAARYLRISRATLYNDIAAGLIATIKDRKRRFVPGSEIARRSALP